MRRSPKSGISLRLPPHSKIDSVLRLKRLEKLFCFLERRRLGLGHQSELIHAAFNGEEAPGDDVALWHGGGDLELDAVVTLVLDGFEAGEFAFHVFGHTAGHGVHELGEGEILHESGGIIMGGDAPDSVFIRLVGAGGDGDDSEKVAVLDFLYGHLAGQDNGELAVGSLVNRPFGSDSRQGNEEYGGENSHWRRMVLPWAAAS